ncbi:sigma-54-dependent transcriptional regulator [Hymenobacter mucosus]|uniref:DNA-binding transcriptional response regulator, NtrC family, contains REC, AAA-type ATPase, and a Fis-type DNA-binding domains n=1 Tax=Hymenobacter mucosus TaxID=1411120 RepID=A0A238Z9R3_9BACT|nr:sigma-54 dependent transcriptional regulator [Hymenobacter mucosus]SNR79822.1 DNA-binding transcriptional response regulator, NtrC family, contains REC, AAA-type ATPase, and a Fis-type DNA-binding domains [Hymenobacter mucosus]
MKSDISTKFNICIVEDDPWYGQLLQYQLSLNPDYTVKLYSLGKEFFEAVQEKPDVITIDFSLPDISGDKLLKKILRHFPGVPVIVISAQSKIATAVELLKLGATDYLVKDEYTKELLWNAIQKIRETSALKQQVQHLERQLQDKYSFNKLLKGNSPAVLRTFDLMERAAQTPVNVSINGETGTGKELVAKAIHMNSERQKGPFVALNMAAIPGELVESELFGHEKGAFTGAISRKIGKFEEANNGTLFLDEIGELHPNVQSKLLRVLQERELQRVGGSEKIKLNVRLVTATHKNLAEETKKGSFREDLYYRIIGLPIVLPPLRDRQMDIILLGKHFLDEFCKAYQKPSMSIAPTAHEKLISYDYPGNVRELKTIIELAAVLSNSREIQPEDILFPPAAKNNGLLAEEKTLREYTCTIIRHHLDKYENNVPLVAKKLDIGRSTIYKMIQDGEF